MGVGKEKYEVEQQTEIVQTSSSSILYIKNIQIFILKIVA